MDALSRARRVIVVALCAGITIAALGPELVRHTVGGDCRVFWQLARAGARLDPSGNLVIDTGPCPLTGGQTVAVWIAAVGIAVIAGVTTLRWTRVG
jgi:hypothetical protein